jgi:hypothetical protein
MCIKVSCSSDIFPKIQWRALRQISKSNLETVLLIGTEGIEFTFGLLCSFVVTEFPIR